VSLSLGQPPLLPRLNLRRPSGNFMNGRPRKSIPPGLFRGDFIGRASKPMRSSARKWRLGGWICPRAGAAALFQWESFPQAGPRSDEATRAQLCLVARLALSCVCLPARRVAHTSRPGGSGSRRFERCVCLVQLS
jgi:hypothetical protein